MRFLIFNIVVLLSIGYLLTASPGQSVGNWLDNTLDTFKKTAEIAPKTDKSLVQTTPSNKAPIIEVDNKSVKSLAENKNKTESNSDEVKITANKIQKIIKESINNNLREIVTKFESIADKSLVQGAVPEKINTVDLATQKPEQKTANTTAVTDIKQKKTTEAEEDLALAFSELYSKNNDVSSSNKHTLMADTTAEKTVFMTPNDRQVALSELIQNLQVTYLERLGD